METQQIQTAIQEDDNPQQHLLLDQKLKDKNLNPTIIKAIIKDLEMGLEGSIS